MPPRRHADISPELEQREGELKKESTAEIESLKKSSFWDFSSEITTFEPSTIIAIANIMFYYDIGDVEYYQINKFLLKSIGIECESQLKDFIAKMKSAIN